MRYAPYAAYTIVQIYKSDATAAPFVLLSEDISGTGMVTDTAVANGKVYCYYAVGITADGAQSSLLTLSCTTPKSDPWPPDGGVSINGGAPRHHLLT